MRLAFSVLCLVLGLALPAAAQEPYDPNVIPYRAARTTVPDCGGLSFAPSQDWHAKTTAMAGGGKRHEYDAGVTWKQPREKGLGKIFVTPLIYSSISCRPHAPHDGAAPDAERIVRRQETYVRSMIASGLGAGKIARSTTVQPIALPGAVSAMVYFQDEGGKKPRSAGYLDIRTRTHEVLVLFYITRAPKAKKRLPAGTVITDTLSTGEVVSGRLTGEGGIAAGGLHVATRSFQDDIGFMMQLFGSFRG